MMAFEYHKQPLAPRKIFLLRLIKFTGLSFSILFFSLLIGMLGYHHLAALSWTDALLNASMILTGMGPVNPMETTQAKLFAACYALYSGIAFLSFAAVLAAPIVHRFLHLLHLDEKEE